MSEKEPDFSKSALLPAIIQDSVTHKVLMLGYMNEESYQHTLKTGKVTFFSRSKQRLWTKGETSGNFLELVEVRVDCDRDTILVKAVPAGPVCHTGADTCFDEVNENPLSFLDVLQELVKDRNRRRPEGSYLASLFTAGSHKIAQKVGEEAVETVIEACRGDREALIEESSDLIFHWIALLESCDLSIYDIIACLKERNK